MLRKIIFYIILYVFSSYTAYGNELKIISKEQFIAENYSSERQELVDFMINQFDDKRKDGITQSQLDVLWNDQELKQAMRLTRFQIVNQKLYADSFDINDYYYKPLLKYFQELIQLHKVKDVDFIIYARDEIPIGNNLEKKTLGIPAFMMSKNTDSIYEKDKLLLPDAFMIEKGKWNVLLDKIEEASASIPWYNKENKLFWRGGAHGSESKYLYNITNFDKLARLKLVMYSKLYPDYINAAFVNYAEFSNDVEGENLKTVLDLLFGKNPQLKHTKEIDHLKYKYLITVDGNTCPWLRVPWIMLSNSVLVKQETSNIEWFYPALKPYVHYVPVNKQLTNMFEKINWMQNHDAEVKNISINAQNFVKNNLMPEHIDIHMALILNEYHSIQKDAQINITLPTAEENFNKIKLLEDKSLDKKNPSKYKSFKNKIKKLYKKLKFTIGV
jgi:hypothetical protein